MEHQIIEKSAKAALTELFLELKDDQTTVVVERVVVDFDSIVRIVRFPAWRASTYGGREVQKTLRKALLKYKLHKYTSFLIGLMSILRRIIVIECFCSIEKPE